MAIYLVRSITDQTNVIGLACVTTDLVALILPPVFIHTTATVENSVIGPYAAIGANCNILSCIIRDSIIEDGSDMTNMILEHSLIGREVKLQNNTGILNIGDQTRLTL